jgi:hypothetical protein
MGYMRNLPRHVLIFIVTATGKGAMQSPLPGQRLKDFAGIPIIQTVWMITSAFYIAMNVIKTLLIPIKWILIVLIL